jgi:hypothetical protein
VRAILERAGSGTSSTMKKITQADVMGLPFPSAVSRDEQRTALCDLDEMFGHLQALRSE